MAHRDSWAILPATQALYNKRTVGLNQAASEWNDCVIYVCTTDDDKIKFLSSCGDLGYPVGHVNWTHHDQTGANKGLYTIRNIVEFKGGEIVSKSNDFGLLKKASLAVFK